jgi:hypothetical protein
VLYILVAYYELALIFIVLPYWHMLRQVAA